MMYILIIILWIGFGISCWFYRILGKVSPIDGIDLLLYPLYIILGPLLIVITLIDTLIN